jgi:hypothetical protein
MPKQKVILVLDTETADLSGSVYDVGYTIANKKGEIMKERNWLVKEVFTNGRRMMGAFFAKKVFSHYAPMLQEGKIRMEPWKYIVNCMRADYFAYGINVLAAYNLAFDRRVMRQTHAQFGDSAPIFPALTALDIWRFACETKLNTRLYKEIAGYQGWITENGNIRTGAEYAYRFCTGDFGFIESHTALSDARIETEILAACYAQHSKIPYNVISGNCWKIVNS